MRSSSGVSNRYKICLLQLLSGVLLISLSIPVQAEIGVEELQPTENRQEVIQVEDSLKSEQVQHPTDSVQEKSMEIPPCKEETKTVKKTKRVTNHKSKTKHVIRYIGKKRSISSNKPAKSAVAPQRPVSPLPCSGTGITVAQLSLIMKHSRNFSGKNLSGLNLQGYSLKNADFSGACMANMNLERADLMESNLERTVLNSSNLHQANLKGASLYGAKLNDVNFEDAIWTDGHLCRPGSTGKCLDIFDNK